MLKKRLIGVVTIKDDWAVQSFGYRHYLPLGKPEYLVENLDRWGVDEILVQVIDRTLRNKGPDFALLEKLGRLGLQTPLIYGGGIRTVAEAVLVIQSGADRLLLDGLLHDDLAVVQQISETLGAQALIGSMPLSQDQREIAWLDYRNGKSQPFGKAKLASLQEGIISEILVIDWVNEGQADAFDMQLVERFPTQNIPLIAFGGLSSPEQMVMLLDKENMAAIAIGNFLSYQEHAIQRYKQTLANMSLRQPAYDTQHSLLFLHD